MNRHLLIVIWLLTLGCGVASIGGRADGGSGVDGGPTVDGGSPVDGGPIVDAGSTPDSGPTPPPGTVTTLMFTATTDTSATVSWTEVDDGTGRPASYDLRYQTAP